jgi:uncharacterized lipoprotein YddW (UPF0748 family)
MILKGVLNIVNDMIKTLFFKLALLFNFSVTLIFLNGCSKGATSKTTITPPITITTPSFDPNALRGVWITTTASTALSSKENIKQTVANCKIAGINNLFVVVYNNARTTYPSQVMQNLLGVSILETFSGRDPLKEIIDEGHAAGLKVHAWFEYGFASSYGQNGGAIIKAKPNWAAKDINGALVSKNNFEWLNAFDPEVQMFLMNLMKEVTTNYDVDGIQGDDRLPALPSTGGYDDYTISLYKAGHGGANPPTTSTDVNWVKWRAGLLNNYMKKINKELKAIKPKLIVSMAPSIYPFSLNEYLQDWPTWVDSGWVDLILPQVYRYDINAYTATLSQQKVYLKNNTSICYPGVLLKSGTYSPDDLFLTQMLQQNRSQGFKGESFFFYEGLKDKLSFFQNQYPFIK